MGYKDKASMVKGSFVSHRDKMRGFFKPRWLIVLVGIIGQFSVLFIILFSAGGSQSPDISLEPVVGQPDVCQVVSVRPFTDAWVHGLEAGLQVKIAQSGLTSDCRIVTQTLHLSIIGLPGNGNEVTVLLPPADFLHVATDIVLGLIFSVTGIAIFLHAQNRPLARVTYALFYCTSLVFLLSNVRGTDQFWLNLLSFLLDMLIRGFSATFVCLFPYTSDKSYKRREKRILPYLPLLIGVGMGLISLPMSLASPKIAFTFTVISFIYSMACMLLIIGVMGWGLRHLSSSERRFVRMVVVGIIFLLTPLLLNFYLIKSDQIIRDGVLRLLPIPLAVLPIACNYKLFRSQLLGTTSMISRQVMRVLLWILLASVFVFVMIMGQDALNRLSLPQITLDYVYAGFLIVSLLLFPFVWNKVRDAGDQVFYGDFYEYNRSLRDLSEALTRLQGIEQISAFMLPRLAALLNATETGLLVRPSPSSGSLPNSGGMQEVVSDWNIYRECATQGNWGSSAPRERFTDERLRRIADLALMHFDQEDAQPILLDGVLLLALYDRKCCNGFLWLGPKFNLEVYSKQDTSFLSTLAAQLSVLEVNNRYLEQAQTDAQQLAALNHRVISAQEEERRHLALELHDEALQQAMLVVRQLSDAGTMADIAEVMPLARSVVASLRRTCLELRPPLLDELGLAEAFRWLAHQFEIRSSTSLCVHVNCLGCWDERPPAAVELALYRVGQEALSNIFKHAQANYVIVRLYRKADGIISLLIADNGRGLQQKQRRAENLGLIGMYERMTAIGGSLQMRTTPGYGVTVRARYFPPDAKCLRLVDRKHDIFPAQVFAGISADNWEEVRL